MRFTYPYDDDPNPHYKFQKREAVARGDAIAKGKTGPALEESFRTDSKPQGRNPASETSKPYSSTAKTKKPTPHDDSSLSGSDKPTVSLTNPNANNAELRLQIQYLSEQVKLLNEKIAGQTTMDTEVPAKPIATSAANSSTTQSTENPVAGIAKPLESPSTTPSQQSKDVEGTSQRSADVPAPSLPTIETSANHVPVRRYGLKSQAQLSNERMKKVLDDNGSAQLAVSSPPSDSSPEFDRATKLSTDGQRLVGQTHAQARLLESLDSSGHTDVNTRLTPPVDFPIVRTPSTLAPTQTQTSFSTSEMSEQSLLDELFPEASNFAQPHYSKRNPYPKLDLPSSTPLVKPYTPKEKLSSREKYLKAFQRSMEKLTALQLLHCSTELTEADFRRLVPKGQHIEGWARDGDFHQIIPGRDSLSLERLPFYYLVFKNPEAALRYQRNASRLHKLSQLHGPSSSLSAIPPPPGLLENGEDVNAALSSYLLTPMGQQLRLNMVVQPYNPALARLIADGGYAPIVPATTPAGKPIHKVLFYIEGYEPSPYDLYQIFMQDALSRGLTWPFSHDHQSIHRLRDIVDLKARFASLSTANPRASSMMKRKLTEMRSHDLHASLSNGGGGDGENAEGQDAQVINQIIMNRVYNRWVIDFSEEDGARRFARLWHRKVLPAQASVSHRTWRDVEEVRMCNAEYLW